MRYKAGFLVLVVGCVLAAPCGAGAESLPAFYGKWKIAGIAGLGEVSSGDADAAKGLGRSVAITATSIILPDDPCDKHALTLDTVQVDRFLGERWQTSRAQLDLGASRLGRTASHIDAACADALVLGPRELLASSGPGAFYLLRREK